MPTKLIVNATMVNVRTSAHALRGPQLAELPCIKDGWLLIEDEHIAGIGSMDQLPENLAAMVSHSKPSAAVSNTTSPVIDPSASVVDAAGRLVLPAWCDSHTHLVFAGSRESEFVDKIRGLSYAEINA